MSEIGLNLQTIQQRIQKAAENAHRDPREITLVAVSKTHPADAIIAAYQAGARHFGENRVEEAIEKIQLVNAQITTLPDRQIVWHLIGHLQSRKVKDAVALFDFIHSVDSVALAQHISERARAINKTMPILLEVNVSGEATKDGFVPTPHEIFFGNVRAILALPNLDVQGLMTIAPIVAQPDDARPHFCALRVLRDQLRLEFPERAWQHLSMGMTNDFSAAIAEGATMIRIGRAIFGERE